MLLFRKKWGFSIITWKNFNHLFIFSISLSSYHGYVLIVKQQVGGITLPVMERALLQAREGRKHILCKSNLHYPNFTEGWCFIEYVGCVDLLPMLFSA